MRPNGGLHEKTVYFSCCPPHTPHPTLFTSTCRGKKQLSNAPFRSRGDAGGAEIWSKNVE
eukprot:scaffold91726_cov12-Tisochrysis_lutea.AAC.1